MIIKAKRILTASGHQRLADHVFRGEENEEIHILMGGEHLLEDAAADARLANTKYAIRHFIISPAEGTTREQIADVVNRLAAEFGFDAADATVLEHKKERYRQAGFERHWHLVVPELRRDGKVLDWSHSYARHEKIARQFEAAYGHAPVVGRHNAAVVAALRTDDPALAARLEPLTQADRPSAAFGDEAHQIARRTGARPLSEVSDLVKSAWSRSDDESSLRTALADQGFRLQEGDKPGVWLVTDGDQMCGSLARLSGQKKAAVVARMAPPQKKEQEHGRDRDRRPDGRVPAVTAGPDRRPATAAHVDGAGSGTPASLAGLARPERERVAADDVAHIHGRGIGSIDGHRPASQPHREPPTVRRVDDARLVLGAGRPGITDATARLGQRLADLRRQVGGRDLSRAEAERLLVARVAAIDAALKVRSPTVPTRAEFVDRRVTALDKTAKSLDRLARSAAADARRHERRGGLLRLIRPSWHRERRRLAERAATLDDAVRRARVVAVQEREHLSARYKYVRDGALAVRRESDARRATMRADREAFVAALARVKKDDRVAIAVSQQGLASQTPGETIRRGLAPPRPVPAPAPRARVPEPIQEPDEPRGMLPKLDLVPRWAKGARKPDKFNKEKR